MRVTGSSLAVLGGFLVLLSAPRSARADGGPPRDATDIVYTYEVENTDAHRELVFVVWPRTCGSTGDPIGTVDLALNPDWASRMHEVDYEIIEKGKKHEVSRYCAETSRVYALPVAAFPRATREAGVDDRELGQKLGAPHAILPALDAIDIKQRMTFFATDPRVLRTSLTLDTRGAPVPSPPPVAIHDVLSVGRFDNTSFEISLKRAVYTYADGATETVAWAGARRLPSSREAPLAPQVAAANLDAGPSADAGPAIASAGAGPAIASPEAVVTDRGTRWVYLAAVSGLIAGGFIAYLRKKRESSGK